MVITECDEVWVNANNVVLPLRRHETGFPSVEVLRILRQHFSQMFEFENLVERKRIYVSRRNASRAPSNEKEIEETLELIGFQIIDCNEMTLFEQFKAFREAEIVVGPHGAGLSNVIFCEPGVKIIELIPPAFHNPCYREISSLAGFHYEAFPYEAFSSAARIIKEVEESIS
jgi:capsular polysaccharide biosynthesis protein